MAKVDRRRKPESAKAKVKKARIARASARRRLSAWKTAASAAEATGHPLNVALHITWSALVEGERRDGHILGLPAVERERRLWAALRAVATRAGVPWLAARAPEYDNGRGLHLHLAFHLPLGGSRIPKSGGWQLAAFGNAGGLAAIRDVLGVVERLTGAPAERVDMRGFSVRGRGRRHYGVVARSACGGWFLQRHVEGKGGDSAALVAYAAKAHGKDAVAGQHRLSHALSALARAA